MPRFDLRSASTALIVPVVALLCVLTIASASSAQIIESRQGDANPMVSVFKSTIYGGLAGLVLGLAVELVDDDEDADAVKWGFVGGTFLGFGYGIYHVTSRPAPGSALLERGPDGWEWGLPEPQLVVRESSPALAALAPNLAAGRRSTGVDASVVRWSF